MSYEFENVDDNFDYDDESYLDPNEVITVQELFNNTKAQEWIDKHRIENNGRLDIASTSKSVGIPVTFDEPVKFDGSKIEFNGSSGMIVGLLEKDVSQVPLGIHINPEDGAEKSKLIFGHELGHWFLEKETPMIHPEVRDSTIEQFCEFFGRQIALPLSNLENINRPITVQEIEKLVKDYEIDFETAFFQLILANKLPRIVFVDANTGFLPNPIRSNKVERRCLCLDCEIGGVHFPVVDIDDIPIFDFSSLEICDQLPFNGCNYIPVETNESFKNLNIMYGRWSKVDDVISDAELRCIIALRNSVFNAYMDGKI